MRLQNRPDGSGIAKMVHFSPFSPQTVQNRALIHGLLGIAGGHSGASTGRRGPKTVCQPSEHDLGAILEVRFFDP